MIEKFFELLLSLISMSHSSMSRSQCNTSVGISVYQSTSSHLSYYDDFHRQVLELSISCLITLSIARGDTSKILSCIKTLLIDCNFSQNSNSKSLHNYSTAAAVGGDDISRDNNNSIKQHSTFNIEVPEIMVLLKVNHLYILIKMLIFVYLP